MKVESESEVAQSCLTLSDPMDCSLPGSSIHGIFQATVLEWGVIAFSLAHTYTQAIKDQQYLKKVCNWGKKKKIKLKKEILEETYNSWQRKILK